MNSHLRRLSVVLLAVPLLVAAGCGDDESSGGSSGSSTVDGALEQRDGMRIEVANVGVAGDPFFIPIKNFMEQAEEDFGVEVNYRETQTFDVQEQARLIQTAVASEPDGLITQMVDADALGDGVNEATDAGIPTVFMTSGAETLGEFDELAYVGAIDLEAGRAGGERFKDEGVQQPICINHQVGNKPLDNRCRGFEEGFGSAVEELAIDGEDPTAAKNRILATLQSNPGIDGIFTLGNTGAAPAIDAVTESGSEGEITLGTIDLSQDILESIQDGTMLFALDQQQGLQAYDAVKTLVMYRQFGFTPPEGLIRTGPVFVTEENAADVLELQKAGLR